MGADTKTVDVGVLTVLDYLLRLKGPRALTNSTWQELSHARAATAKLIEAAKDAHYVGLMVGEDCTWMLAKLQREGVYKPTCSDGKPSRADAGKDLEKIQACRTRLSAALRAVGGAK